MLGTYLSTCGSISTCHHLSQQAQFRCQMFQLGSLGSYKPLTWPKIQEAQDQFLDFLTPKKIAPKNANFCQNVCWNYIYIYIYQNNGNASCMFNQMDKSQSSATVLSKNLPPLFFDFTTLNPKMSKNVPITLQGAVTIQSIANRLWFARPTILPLLLSRRFHPRERPRPFPRFFLIQRLRRSKCGLKRKNTKKKTVKCY